MRAVSHCEKNLEERSFFTEMMLKKKLSSNTNACFNEGSRLLGAALQVFNCLEHVPGSFTVAEPSRWVHVLRLWSRDIVLPAFRRNRAKIITLCSIANAAFCHSKSNHSEMCSCSINWLLRCGAWRYHCLTAKKLQICRMYFHIWGSFRTIEST